MSMEVFFQSLVCLIPAGKSRRQITGTHELTSEHLMVTINYFGLSSFNFRNFSC